MLPFLSLCMSLAALNSLSLVVAAAQHACPDSFRQRCLSFAPEQLIRNSTRTRLEHVAGGTTLRLTENVASCGRPSQAVSANLCRVALQIPTSGRSGIAFELWLPEEWDGGRYVATGNGGIDGCMRSRRGVPWVC